MRIALLRAIEAELAQLRERLAALIAEAERDTDPLVLHIYQARRRYQAAAAADRSKHQRSVEHEIDRSYTQARTLHYLGTRHEWMNLLRSNRWTAEASQPLHAHPSPRVRPHLRLAFFSAFMLRSVRHKGRPSTS